MLCNLTIFLPRESMLRLGKANFRQEKEECIQSAACISGSNIRKLDNSTVTSWLGSLGPM